MASFLQAIRDCITGPTDDQPNNYNATLRENAIASDLLVALFNAEKPGADLNKSTQEIVGASGWTENIAKAVLNGLVQAIKDGAHMGLALTEAFTKASAEAKCFVCEHPVLCTVIALGILVLLMPWALEALGFAELGPVEGEMDVSTRHKLQTEGSLGSFAAWWQATYGAGVPAGSLFSFFQRLGMVWHLKASVGMAGAKTEQ